MAHCQEEYDAAVQADIDAQNAYNAASASQNTTDALWDTYWQKEFDANEAWAAYWDCEDEHSQMSPELRSEVRSFRSQVEAHRRMRMRCAEEFMRLKEERKRIQRIMAR